MLGNRTRDRSECPEVLVAVVSEREASTLPSHEPRSKGPRLTANHRRFLLGAGPALGAICIVGWLTGLRGALHGLVLAMSAVALFPFILLLGFVLLVCAASALAALAGDGAGELLAAGAADGVTTGGGKLVRGYYRLFWRLRRHPVLWGLAAGLGLGGAGLALVLWLFVLPREAATLATLLEVKAQIDAKGGPGAESPVALPLDAFGHPIQYRRQGSRLMASYVLTSLGFDGVPGSDDICVGGRNRLGALLDHAQHPLETLRSMREGGLDAAARSQMLRDTRCQRMEEAR